MPRFRGPNGVKTATRMQIPTTSIFEMSLAPLNFENHFFVFDVGLQKSLFLNINAINVEFSALV